MEAIKRRLIEASVIFVIVLAMLVALEVAARLARLVVPRPSPEGERIVLKHDWGKQYLADQARLRFGHENYVEFREKAMHSPTVNVERGTRAVPGSCLNPRGEAFRILLFGGSTMFGYGVPDRFTIPAYLAEAFARTGRCVEVVNYGAGWWQSSQSVVQLLKVLRAGVRLDAVVFYDGVNEATIVIRGGAPGEIAPEAQLLLKDAFEEDLDWKKLVRKSVLIRGLAGWLSRDTPEAGKTGAADRARQLDAARRVSETYVHNVRAVEALAKEYGFTAYFFLQPFPAIAHKVNTELEDAVIRKWTNGRDNEMAFIRAAYDETRNAAYLKGHPRFHDISALFDGMTQELYSDSQHLLPDGNRLVAQRMASEIKLGR